MVSRTGLGAGYTALLGVRGAGSTLEGSAGSATNLKGAGMLERVPFPPSPHSHPNLVLFKPARKTTIQSKFAECPGRGCEEYPKVRETGLDVGSRDSRKNTVAPPNASLSAHVS